MKIYISGPISANIPGTTHEDRRERFHLCEAWILKNQPDWEPVNPLHVEACPNPATGCGGPANNRMRGVVTFEHTWECFMRYDLKALLDCDAVALLPGWDRSPGANLEHNLAHAVGMRFYFVNEDGSVEV